jgi:hypothetical protein
MISAGIMSSYFLTDLGELYSIGKVKTNEMNHFLKDSTKAVEINFFDLDINLIKVSAIDEFFLVSKYYEDLYSWSSSIKTDKFTIPIPVYIEYKCFGKDFSVACGLYGLLLKFFFIIKH